MAMEVPGNEGEEDPSTGGWITSRPTYRRENCQGWIQEAQDRVQWRRLDTNYRPHIKMGKDAES